MLELLFGVFVVCMIGLKSTKQFLHDMLKMWGIQANADDSPDTWTGVTTCADNGDIIKLFYAENITGGCQYTNIIERR